MRILLIIAQKWTVAGGQVHVITLKEQLMKRGNAVISISSLKSILFLNPALFDVIHVHGVERLWPILFGYIWAKIFKRSLIVTVHSFGPPSWYWHPVKRALMKIGMQGASKFIFVSNFLKQEFLRYCNSLSQIDAVVVYNGVDINRFKPMPITTINRFKTELDLEGKYVVFYAGRLSKSKNITCLLMAIRELVNSSDNIVLVIAGEGEMKPKLQHMARKLKIKGMVKWLGAVPHDKIHTYYALCDVFVLPSTYEALSISILEAMSCGKPIIASNVGGIPELVVNDINGYLVSPNKSKDFADAILQLYKNPKKASQIGKENRIKVEKCFSLDFMIDKIVEVYEQSMKEGKCS